MMRNRIRGLGVFGLVFVVIGCGSGGGAGPATTQAALSTTTADEASGESAATTVLTTAAENSGGGTAAGVCDLVTADELAGIFNVASVTTSVLEGPPDNCIVESDAGDPLTAWSLTTDQAQVVFDALRSDPSSIEVPGSATAHSSWKTQAFLCSRAAG